MTPSPAALLISPVLISYLQTVAFCSQNIHNIHFRGETSSRPCRTLLSDRIPPLSSLDTSSLVCQPRSICPHTSSRATSHCCHCWHTVACFPAVGYVGYSYSYPIQLGHLCSLKLSHKTRPPVTPPPAKISVPSSSCLTPSTRRMPCSILVCFAHHSPVNQLG